MQNLLLLLLTLMALPLVAQYQLQSTFSGEDGLYLEELEQVQVGHTLGAVRQIQLRVEVHDAGGSLLYSRESLPFTLEAGRAAPVPQIWKRGHREFIAPALEQQIREDRALPRGQYEICVLVLDAVSKTVPARQCRLLDVAPAAFRTTKFQTSGQVRLSHHYAERQWFGSTLPPRYWRFEANPTFSWQGIPVGLDVFWTNEDNRFGRPMDAVSLRFDVQSFRVRLRQQLEARLEEKRAAIQQQHQPDFAEEAALKQILTHTEKVDTSLLYQWLPRAEARLDSLKDLEADWESSSIPNAYADSLRNEWEQQSDSLTEAHQGQLAGKDSLLQVKRIELERQVEKLRQQRRQYEQLLRRKAYLENKWREVRGLTDSIRQAGQTAIARLSPQQFKNKLLENQLLAPGKAALLSVEQLQLGAYYLDHTPLAFNGSQINGVNFAFHPTSKWTISLAGGKVQAPRFTDSLFAVLPAPYTLAQKISREAGRNLVYYLGSIYTWGQNSDSDYAGERNWILTTGWHWRLPKLNGHWTVDIARNGWNKNFGDDLAWQTEFSSSFLNNRFDIYANWQKVGRLYQDFGSPFLRSGMETKEAQLTSRWWKGQLQVGLFYQHDQNRPLGYSPFRLQNHQMGGHLQLNLPQGTSAFLRLGYNLLEQSEQHNATYLYHAYLQQSWQIGAMPSTSRLVFRFSQQQWNPLLPPTLYQYQEFRQQIQIGKIWSLELAAYHTYEQLNRAVPALTYRSEQAFSGIDVQNAFFFSNGSQLNATIGFYNDYGTPELHWKVMTSAQIAVHPQLGLKLTAAWGQLPNLNAIYDQSFLNASLQWNLGQY